MAFFFIGCSQFRNCNLLNHAVPLLSHNDQLCHHHIKHIVESLASQLLFRKVSIKVSYWISIKGGLRFEPSTHLFFYVEARYAISIINHCLIRQLRRVLTTKVVAGRALRLLRRMAMRVIGSRYRRLRRWVYPGLQSSRRRLRVRRQLLQTASATVVRESRRRLLPQAPCRPIS